MENMKITVSTRTTAEGRIEQFTDYMGHIIRNVADVQEKQVKDALMKMGWMPPDEVERLKRQNTDLQENNTKLVLENRELKAMEEAVSKGVIRQGGTLYNPQDYMIVEKSDGLEPVYYDDGTLSREIEE